MFVQGIYCARRGISQNLLVLQLRSVFPRCGTDIALSQSCEQGEVMGTVLKNKCWPKSLGLELETVGKPHPRGIGAPAKCPICPINLDISVLPPADHRKKVKEVKFIFFKLKFWFLSSPC